MNFGKKVETKTVEVEVQSLYEELVKNFSPTTEKVRELFQFLENNQNDEFYNFYNWIIEESENVITVGEYSLKLEEVEGGHEGGGEDHWAVVSIYKGEEKATYWRIPGYYQSYAGGELEFLNTYQVFPYEEMARFWSETEKK